MQASLAGGLKKEEPRLAQLVAICVPADNSSLEGDSNTVSPLEIWSNCFVKKVRPHQNFELIDRVKGEPGDFAPSKLAFLQW